jgi:hypothetical protein
MTVSEEREVAVRKEMAVMYEEGVTCEGMAVEGARVPATAVPAATAPVPSTTTTKTAPATMHSHGGRAAMAISAISVLRNIDFSS